MARRFFTLTAPFLALGLALGSVAPEAYAKKKKKRAVALFPFITRDTPNKGTVDGVFGLLSKASGLIDSVVVIPPKYLGKKFKKDPGKVIDACGTNLGCIAKLGKKVKANEVLLGRAVPDGSGGVKVSFLIIDVKKKGVARKMSLTFSGPKDVKTVLGGAFYEIFGITDPGYLKITNASGVVRVDGKIVGKGKGPHKVPPGRHEVAVNGATQSVMITPGKTKTINANAGSDPVAVAAAPPPPPAPEPRAEPPSPKPEPKPKEDSAISELALLPLDPGKDAGGASDSSSSSSDTASSSSSSETSSDFASSGSSVEPETTTIAAVSADSSSTATSSRSSATDGGGPGLFTWVGIGTAVAGIAAASAGAFLYFDAASLRDSVEAGRSGGMVQTEAAEQVGADPNDLENQSFVGTGNMGLALLVAGAGVAAAGGVLMTLDLTVFQPKTSVAVGPNAGAIHLQWDF